MSGKTLLRFSLCLVFLFSVFQAQAEDMEMQPIDDAKAQKSTMADIRSIATAVGAYAVDEDYYPKGVSDLQGLESFVVPMYIRMLPQKDGWGRSFVFTSTDDGSSFTVISYGRDGVASGPSVGATNSPDDDIVYKDGAFVTWPAAKIDPASQDPIDDTKAQKITMADIRSIATAVGAYAVDEDHYPKGVSDLQGLESFVVPMYIGMLPQKDGWGRSFVFTSTDDGSSFTVISYGRDGVASGPSVGATNSPDDDIVYKDGAFVTWPAAKIDPASQDPIDDAKAQKITMADIRSIAIAVGAYAVDEEYYPKGVSDLQGLESFVVPMYIEMLPQKDGWGRSFVFTSTDDGSSFTVISYGRDGVASGPSVGATNNPDDDIVLKNGAFVAWPASAVN